jgi:hypothetical protein
MHGHLLMLTRQQHMGMRARAHHQTRTHARTPAPLAVCCAHRCCHSATRCPRTSRYRVILRRHLHDSQHWCREQHGTSCDLHQRATHRSKTPHPPNKNTPPALSPACSSQRTRDRTTCTTHMDQRLSLIHTAYQPRHESSPCQHRMSARHTQPSTHNGPLSPSLPPCPTPALVRLWWRLPPLPAAAACWRSAGASGWSSQTRSPTGSLQEASVCGCARVWLCMNAPLLVTCSVQAGRPSV